MTPDALRYTAGDARVYRIPLDLFPGLTGFAHVVLADGLAALIDVGSGFGASNEQLEAGLDSIARDHQEPVGWDRLTHVVISHGHIDHYGGLGFVRERTDAPVGVHAFDRDLLTRFETTLEATAGRLDRFLVRGGVSDSERRDLIDLYRAAKSLFSSQPVDFTLRPDRSLGPIRWLHTPGHCPGQVVFRVDDLLLTSDHVLPGTTPHMAPAWLARHTGLRTYLESLDRVKRWGAGARLGLGGHGPEMRDVAGRLAEIRAHHARRLSLVRRALREPKTVAELADRLFPNAGGYHRLLALEEAGAHLEYLQQRGEALVRPGGRSRIGRWRLAPTARAAGPAPLAGVRVRS